MINAVVRTCPAWTVKECMRTVAALHDRFKRLCSRCIDCLELIERLGPVLRACGEFQKVSREHFNSLVARTPIAPYIQHVNHTRTLSTSNMMFGEKPLTRPRLLDPSPSLLRKPRSRPQGS